MIPEEVENRIARYYFHNYLPTKIGEELESLLLHYYLMDEEPDTEETVSMAIQFINNASLN